MAQRKIEMSMVVVFVVMLLGGATAQSGCTTALMSLSSCLNYVTGSSSTPPSSCCSQLTSVVRSQPQCLCLLLNGGGSSLGITINQTLALALPGACKVQTPPVSQCKTAANGPRAAAPLPQTSPVSSPADESNGVPPSSPADTSDDLPENPTSSGTIPSGTASKTVPATDRRTSGGNALDSSFGMTIIALFLSATMASIVIKV